MHLGSCVTARVCSVAPGSSDTSLAAQLTRLHRLHGLRAGEAAQGWDVVFIVKQLPQALCANSRQRVLDLQAAAEARLRMIIGQRM